MRRSYVLGIWTLVPLAYALLTATSFAQQKSLKEQLDGTWTVVSWLETFKDGSKLQRFGPDPKGVNIFTADGHFSIMYARPDLPKIASNDPMKPTPEEANAIMLGSIAYFGTYTVDEGSKTISFRIESTTLPNQLGMNQMRKITSLTADELSYTNDTPVAEPAHHIDTAYKRAK
ncbi:MAG: lipocalin-like domain-containing protein [Pseudolabrys sp.]